MFGGGSVRDTAYAMSQEDLEIVRRNFEALAAGEAGVLFERAHPEIRVFPRPAEPDAAAEYRGLEGLMEYVINWFGQWDDYDSELVEVTDAGEHILAVVRERGRAPSGPEVEGLFSHSFVLRDGKVVEWHMYDSHAEALAAVGLSA